MDRKTIDEYDVKEDLMINAEDMFPPLDYWHDKKSLSLREVKDKSNILNYFSAAQVYDIINKAYFPTWVVEHKHFLSYKIDFLQESNDAIDYVLFNAHHRSDKEGNKLNKEDMQAKDPDGDAMVLFNIFTRGEKFLKEEIIRKKISPYAMVIYNFYHEDQFTPEEFLSVRPRKDEAIMFNEASKENNALSTAELFSTTFNVSKRNRLNLKTDYVSKKTKQPKKSVNQINSTECLWEKYRHKVTELSLQI